MNGILVIHKEKDLTSRDVVNKVCKLLKTKKIGHTGTLDPLAEGVLVLCIGNGTKLCELLTSTYKEYIAEIFLGIETDTLDITGKIIKEKDYKITEEQVKSVLNSFLGESIQTTPIYSAVKVNGKRLYEYAREGIKVELPTRKINISNIELLEIKDNKIKFKVKVSKGTYIRALIKDICKKLNTVGTMSYLCRTKQGEFTIENSYTLKDIENNQYNLLTIDEVLQKYKTIDINETLYNQIKNGAIIDKNFKEELVCLKYKNKIIAIYQTYDKDKTKAKPYKMFIDSL